MFQKMSIWTGFLMVVFMVSTLAPADAKFDRKISAQEHPRTPMRCATSEQLRELSGHEQDNVRYNCGSERLTLREAVEAMYNSEIYYTDRERNGFLVRFPGELIFASGSAVVESDARRTLHRFARVLNRYDNSVTVNGHASTPDINTSLYPSNQVLSEVRAWHVGDYMVNHLDVERHRVSTRGYGEEYPFNVEIDDASERLNRRVDFFVQN